MTVAGHRPAWLGDADIDPRDFLLTDSERRFRRVAQDVIKREVLPLALDIETKADWDAIRRIIHRLGTASLLQPLFRGWADCSHPSVTLAAILAEELANTNYAAEATLASSLSAAYAIDRYGSPRVRERYLEPLVSGEAIGAICFTEPGAGSDVSAMATRIDADPTKQIVTVTGSKRYVSNAGIADVYVVFGFPQARRRGVSAVVVPSETSGVESNRTYQLMGRRGATIGEMEFNSCQVTSDHVLGEENAKPLMHALFNVERVLVAGSALGVARSAFDIATRHAQTRRVFGELLGCKQLVWAAIADMSCRLEAAELLTYRAARLCDNGAPDKLLRKPAFVAKLVASEAAVFCADSTVQILGGEGLTAEYGRAEQIYRDARALPIVGGTTEMGKYVIASTDLPEVKPGL